MRRTLSPGTFRQATSGVVAIEFAFIVPILLSVFFGGYAMVRAVAISRKVTITTRALADLTTQFATMSASDMSTVINASAQIMAPYDPAPLGLRLSEITTDASGQTATVTWSKAVGMTAYNLGAPFTLPAGMLKPNISYVFSETRYQYTPLTGFAIGPFNVSDHIYMLPRVSSSVAYTGG